MRPGSRGHRLVSLISYVVIGLVLLGAGLLWRAELKAPALRHEQALEGQQQALEEYIKPVQEMEKYARQMQEQSKSYGKAVDAEVKELEAEAERMHRETQLLKLRLGMTMAEVQETCGPPDHEQVFQDKRGREFIWYYGDYSMM